MTGPPAATAAVRVAVRAVLDDGPVAAAVSGGADSLALAAATRFVGQKGGRRVGLVTVDHGLQEGSDRRARSVAAWARDAGFDPVRIETVSVAGLTGGPEAAARTARYEALSTAAGDLGAAAVLLGHTRDDQAETVLLGLARGSGTRSLAGMAARAGALVRPLLNLPRTTTAAACAELGLEPWQDPHNQDRGYARVRVREQVLPVLEAALGPGVAEALARTALLARDDADLLDALAADADPGEPALSCAVVAPLPAALRRRVLRRWLLRHGAAEVTARHVAAVEVLVTRWHGQGEIHLPGVRVTRQDGSLHCQPDD